MIKCIFKNYINYIFFLFLYLTQTENKFLISTQLIDLYGINCNISILEISIEYI